MSDIVNHDHHDHLVYVCQIVLISNISDICMFVYNNYLLDEIRNGAAKGAMVYSIIGVIVVIVIVAAFILLRRVLVTKKGTVIHLLNKLASIYVVFSCLQNGWWQRWSSRVTKGWRTRSWQKEGILYVDADNEILWIVNAIWFWPLPCYKRHQYTDRVCFQWLFGCSKKRATILVDFLQHKKTLIFIPNAAKLQR